MTIADDVLAGDRRALARALTLVERAAPQARAMLAALYSATGRAHLVGITGAPGAGKSTLINALAAQLRIAGDTVAVLAIDPSSAFSRGAVLGDRIRMQDLVHDSGAFVRSMASRGAVGGVARASAAAIDVLDAAGFDRVLVETVGVGQSELDIAALVHTVVLVEAPGLGDEVQAIKAGVLEIADIVVLNKGDLPHADAAQRTLALALSLAQPAAGAEEWQPPLLRTDALGKHGMEGVLAALNAHRSHARDGRRWAERQALRAQAALASELSAQLYTSFMEHLPPAQLAELVAAIAARTRDPYSAATQLLATRS